MAVIRIYDGKSFIGEVTEEQIIVTMGGEAAMANEHMKKDFEGLMAFVRSRSSEEHGVITADMRELLKGNGLDAAKTTSLFWLAAVMGQKKILNKLSPVTVMKLLPLIAAKTKAAELNKKSMGNDLERLLEFSRAYTECTKKIAAGEMTADTAAERLLTVLPSERLARSEAKERPQIIGVLKGVRDIGNACADPETKEKMSEYFDKIKDIL